MFLHVYLDDEHFALVEVLEEGLGGSPAEGWGVREVLVEISKEYPGLWVDEGAVRD